MPITWDSTPNPSVPTPQQTPGITWDAPKESHTVVPNASAALPKAQDLPQPEVPHHPDGLGPPPRKPITYHPATAIRAEPSWEQAAATKAHEIWGDVTHGFGEMMANVSHGMNDALVAGDAVLGAPGRFVTGMVGANKPEEAIRNAIDNVEHPAHNGHNLEMTMNRLGVSRGVDALNGKIPTQYHGFVDSVGKILTGVITDPLNLIPVVGEIGKVADISAHVMSAMHGAAQVTGTGKLLAPYVRQVQAVGRGVAQDGAKLFGRRPELNGDMGGVKLTGKAKAGRISTEDSVMQKFTQKNAANSLSILQKHKDDINKGIVPADLIEHVAQTAFERGDIALQNQAIAHSPKLAAQWNGKTLPPASNYLGQGDLDLDNLFGPGGSAPGMKVDDWNKLLGKARYASEKAEIDKQTVDLLSNHDMHLVDGSWSVDRVTRGARGPKGRFLPPQTNTVQVSQLGNVPGTVKALPAEMRAKAEDMVTHMTTGPKDIKLFGGGAIDEALAKVRQLGSRSVQLNPLPHGVRNLGLLQYISHGPVAFGKMMGYALKGLDQSQRERLANSGLAHMDYLRENATGPLGPLYRADAIVLNRLELGARMASLEAYDHELGPSRYAISHELGVMDDRTTKADLVRRDLGDYRNASLLVRIFGAMGGPFVAFRIGTVPGTVGRAFRARPGNVENVIRTEVGLNDNSPSNEHPGPFAGTPTRLVGGGPVDDALRLGTNPSDYVMNQSTIGPLGAAIQWQRRTREGFGNSPLDILEQNAENYVPGAALVGEGLDAVQEVLHQNPSWHPYGNNAGLPGQPSALSQLLYSTFWGAYTTPKPKPAAIRRRTRNMERDVNREN